MHIEYSNQSKGDGGGDDFVPVKLNGEEMGNGFREMGLEQGASPRPCLAPLPSLCWTCSPSFWCWFYGPHNNASVDGLAIEVLLHLL
jgi:hypothetical protein